jgi:type IV pilus assembly protein PilM
MTLRMVIGKTLPIGMDIGTSTVKLVQMRQAQDNIELLAAGSCEIPVECRKDPDQRMDFLLKNVRTILKSNRFKGRHCIFSLPAEATVVQHLRLPKGTPQDTQALVESELQGKLPYPVSDAVVRYIVAGEMVGEGEVKQEIIAVASARAVLEAYLQMTRRAGLDVVGVNIEPCAIVECFSRLFRRSSDAGRTILFIDMGASTTQVVLSHGDQVAFARNLFAAGDQLDRAVADGLKVSLDQARQMRLQLMKGKQDTSAEDALYHLLDAPLDSLADELTQCLRYYESVFRNQGVERAIFLGGQANDTRLCQAIARRLNLPAQVGDPLARVKRVEGAGLAIGLDRRGPHPSWAVAVGLSLGATLAA